MSISSKELANQYVKFYRVVREYLWPFDVLYDLAEVESDIYTAFVDGVKLSDDFAKLSSSFKDVLSEDEEFKEEFDALKDMIDEYNSEDTYYKLPSVTETDPELTKTLSVKDENDEEEIEDENY